MLRITIELWPGGKKGLRKEIASMAIGNVSDLAETSDYCVRFEEQASPHLGIEGSCGEVYVLGHNRSQTVWALLEKAARKAKEASRVPVDFQRDAAKLREATSGRRHTPSEILQRKGHDER